MEENKTLVEEIREVAKSYGDEGYMLSVGCNYYFGDKISEKLNGWADRIERLKRPEPEALDADGVPIHKGDTVWCKKRVFSDDCMCEVVSVGRDSVMVKRSLGGANDVRIEPKYLTHKQPDSLERIEDDAKKITNDYWGCKDSSCCYCPALIDGKIPSVYYGAKNCNFAMHLDLLRRQRDVLERGQE